jgi:hypothetical protein
MYFQLPETEALRASRGSYLSTVILDTRMIAATSAAVRNRTR